MPFGPFGGAPCKLEYLERSISTAGRDAEQRRECDCCCEVSVPGGRDDDADITVEPPCGLPAMTLL